MKYLLVFPMLLFSLSTIADAVNETVAMSCDKASQEMKVVSTFVNLSHMEMNRIPECFSLDLTTCDFLSETKAKITLHEMKASLRGKCGANPEIQLELIQPDGKLIQTTLSPKCGGTLIKSITMSKNTTEICEYITINYKAPWTPKTLESEYVCRKI